MHVYEKLGVWDRSGQETISILTDFFALIEMVRKIISRQDFYEFFKISHQKN